MAAPTLSPKIDASFLRQSFSPATITTIASKNASSKSSEHYQPYLYHDCPHDQYKSPARTPTVAVAVEAYGEAEGFTS